MTTEVQEKVFEDIGAELKKLDKLDKLDALDGLIAKFKEPKKEPEVKEPEAEMKEGITAGITQWKLWEIPAGQIAVGTFGGVFINEIIDGFLAAQGTMTKGVVKLVGAGLVGAWGRRWLGKDASLAIAIVLGVFGLSQVLPIDKWAAQLAGGLKGVLPGTIKVTGMPAGTAVAQAQQVADYYGQAHGR